jgi:Na+-translocating ferredoxin:NAD+ oxidoreductase RNF subunit RnfB
MVLILWCLGIMLVLGVLFGVGLAVASRFFHVATDARVEAVLAALPGVNCGACGFAGCEGYARAVVEKKESPALCIPGGRKTAASVAQIMGLAAGEAAAPPCAVVHCQGGTDRCGRRAVYQGIADCRAAQMMQGGDKACEFGCLGYGTCAAVCPFGAMTMGPDRIPVVDRAKCTACGLCVKACPRRIIELLPNTSPVCLACCSQDKGAAVKTTCKVGCIACWICVKVSPPGSVEKNGNLPKLTYPAGVDYAAALEKCPMHCFVKVGGGPAKG